MEKLVGEARPAGVRVLKGSARACVTSEVLSVTGSRTGSPVSEGWRVGEGATGLGTGLRELGFNTPSQCRKSIAEKCSVWR